MSMSHEEFRSRMQDHLSGQMQPGQETLFQEHRECCSACADLLKEERILWDMLGPGDPDSLGTASSVWPEVRHRTFGARGDGAWFFGHGQYSRAGLAAGALAAGLAFGWLLPTWTGPAGTMADGNNSASYEAQSSWLDDSSAYDLAGLWLDMGSAEESDGS
jgi:hypothetical protein